MTQSHSLRARKARKPRQRSKRRLTAAKRRARARKGGLARAAIIRNAWPTKFRQLYDRIHSDYRCRFAKLLDFATSWFGHAEFGIADIDISLVQAHVKVELSHHEVKSRHSRLFGLFRSVEIALPHIEIPSTMWRLWNDTRHKNQPAKAPAELPLNFQRTLSVPFADWPTEHLQRWQRSTGMTARSASVAPSDKHVFDEYAAYRDDEPSPSKRPKPLRASTASHAELAYSNYLYHVRSNGLPDLVTKDSAQSWMDECKNRGASALALITYLSQLKMVMQRCEPERDWRFLSKMSTKLRKLRRKPRRAIDITAEQLFALGLELIRQALAAPRRSARTAIRFRNGLLLCFLITVPLRSGNVASLRKGIELLLDDDPRVELPASAMKNNQAFEQAVPVEIAALIRLYIEEFRPALAARGNQLWRTLGNGADLSECISQKQVNAIVKSIVKRALRKNFHVHLTRHAAARFMAERYPEQARLIRDLLGHEGPTSTLIYAGQTIAAAAGRHLQEASKALLQDARSRIPGMANSNPRSELR